MNHTLRLIALGVVALGAAGCTSPLTNGRDQAISIDQVYPIVVEPQVATLVVRVDEGLQSLARGEEDRVHAFVARWKSRGQGMLNAAAPTGTPNEAAAIAALAELKKVLAAEGVSDKSVMYSSYRAAGDDKQAPITLTFVTYVATASECGTNWSQNLAYNPRNMPWPEFGCSTQRNLAAIVADPRDFIEPHTTDPADANRRSTVFEKYRKGEPTATKETKQDSGSVSTVSQ